MAEDPYAGLGRPYNPNKEAESEDPYAGLGTPYVAEGQHKPATWGETAADVAKQIPAGVNRAIAGMAALPKTIMEGTAQLLGADPDWTGRHLSTEQFGVPDPLSAAARYLTSPEMAPEPETAAGQVAGSVAEVGAGAVPVAGSLFKLSQLATRVPRYEAVQKPFRKLAEDIVNNPGMFAAGEATGAGTAGVAIGAAREAGLGPEGQFYAGIAGGLAPSAAFMLPSAQLLRGGKNALARTLPPEAADTVGNIAGDRAKQAYQSLTAGQTEKATSAVRSQMQRELANVPPNVIDEAEGIESGVPGLRLTLAEKTESPTLLQGQEQASRNLPPDMLAQEIARRKGNVQAVETATNVNRPRAEYDPEFIVDQGRRVGERARQTVANRENALLEENQAIAGEINEAGRYSGARGRQVRDELTAARDQTRQEMRAMADDLGLNDPALAVDIEPLRQRLTQSYRSTNRLKYEGGESAPVEHPLIGQLADLERNQSVPALMDLRSNMQEELSTLARNPTAGNAGQRRGLGAAVRELDRFLDELSTTGVEGQGFQETAALRNEMDAAVEMQRFAWRHGPQSKPQSFTQFVINEGGIDDAAREVRHIMGEARQRPGLVNQGGRKLDEIGERAFEEGFFRERPTEAEVLDMLQEDLGSGRMVRLGDEEALDNWSIAREYEQELAQQGVTGARTELDVRRMYRDAAMAEGNRGGTVRSDDFASRYRQFRQAYDQRYIDRFEKGVAYKALHEGRRGYRLEDEALASAFFDPNNPAATRQYLDIFGGETPALRSAAMESLAKAAVRDGEVNANAINAWAKRHREILEHTPGIRRDVENYGQAVREIGQTRETMRQRSQAIDRSVLNRELAKVDRGDMTPEQFIDRAMTNPQRMRALMEALPDQQERIAAAVWERALAQKNPLEFLDKNRRAMIQSLGSRRVRQMIRLLRATQKIKQVPEPMGAQPTGQPHVDKVQSMLNTGLNQISSRIFAAQSGRTSWRYIGTDIAGRVMRGYSERQAGRILMEAMLDPNLAAELTQATTGTIRNQKLLKLHTYLVAIGLGPDIVANESGQGQPSNRPLKFAR